MTSSISDKIAARVAERNSWPTYTPKKLRHVFKMLWENKTEVVLQKGGPTPEWLDKNFPLKEMDWKLLRSPKSPDKIQSTWIGHATVFAQMGNFNILTDPLFSERCSPVQSGGTKRFQKPACTIDELMVKEKVRVDVVLISHNHYDHLDYHSVKDLAKLAIKENQPIEFVVSLGLLSWFKKNVPNSLKGGNTVTELDWHESYTTKGKDGTKLSITPVPMQHWTSRNGLDRDKTLWCGFSVKVVYEDNNKYGSNFLFTGDTGWFDAAHQVGEKYGPFDLAAIPIGAYAPRWFMEADHMDPDDAVKFMTAVKAKKATPIHWGTFPLTSEPILEPRERLVEAMKAAGKEESTFTSCLIGETIYSD